MSCLVKRFLFLLIWIYRLILSPFLGGNCRFHPSCSQYAIDVLKTESLGRAFYLIMKRLLSCQPFGPYGYYPHRTQQTLEGKSYES